MVEELKQNRQAISAAIRGDSALISGKALNWIYCPRNFNLDREYKMVRKIIAGVCFTLMMTGLTGCSNPHKDAARAAEEASNSETEINKQKAEIVEDYRKCLNKNPSDAAACDGYKQALDAM